jgi:hypothetical protein
MMRRSPAILLVLGALGLALALPPPATAQPLRKPQLTDTGLSAPVEPTSHWPDRVLVDATTWTLLAVWTGAQAEERLIPMASIARFERARAYEGRPDELVAVLKDKERILVARGSHVGTAATLITAVVGREITEVSSSEPWPAATRDDGSSPETSLALGSVHTGAQVAAAMESASQEAASAGPVERRSVMYDVAEALPANADPEALDINEIRISVQKQMSRIRQCYQRELQRQPELSGRVTVWFLIAPDGSVDRARLRESTMNNILVEDCIVDEVKAMSFSKPQAGKSVPVSFPFNFTGA